MLIEAQSDRNADEITGPVTHFFRQLIDMGSGISVTLLSIRRPSDRLTL